MTVDLHCHDHRSRHLMAYRTSHAAITALPSPHHPCRPLTPPHSPPYCPQILRSMLYRGSEVLKEVAWVVFDEVHYMQDKDRGVVWEETIIFLPDTVKMVFLSATLSNSREFAEWVCHLRKQPTHVVYTGEWGGGGWGGGRHVEGVGRS